MTRTKVFSPICTPASVIEQMNMTLTARRTPDIHESSAESRTLLITIAAEYGYRITTDAERSPFHDQRSDLLFTNGHSYLGSYDNNLWDALRFESASGWPEEQHDGPPSRLTQLLSALRNGE